MDMAFPLFSSLVRQEVEARITIATVGIFYRGQRVWPAISADPA